MALKIKRYLGQNFLVNRNFVFKIIEAADIDKNDIVLEAGPGKGILTEELIKKAGKIIAIEKDKELASFLTDKFNEQENLQIVRDDILKFNPENYSLKHGCYKIVANIPYYITSHFLRKFLQSNYQPSLMALMLQKEVAERTIAKNAKESILSISVKAYGNPRIIANVPAGNFFPKPKVDSAILLISDISKKFFDPPTGGKIDEKKFFELVRIGFSQKRKLLKNNLFHLLDAWRLTSTKQLEKCGIPALSRAEDLSLENWKCLAQAIC